MRDYSNVFRILLLRSDSGKLWFLLYISDVIAKTIILSDGFTLWEMEFRGLSR